MKCGGEVEKNDNNSNDWLRKKATVFRVFHAKGNELEFCSIYVCTHAMIEITRCQCEILYDAYNIRLANSSRFNKNRYRYKWKWITMKIKICYGKRTSEKFSPPKRLAQHTSILQCTHYTHYTRYYIFNVPCSNLCWVYLHCRRASKAYNIRINQSTHLVNGSMKRIEWANEMCGGRERQEEKEEKKKKKEKRNV